MFLGPVSTIDLLGPGQHSEFQVALDIHYSAKGILIFCNSSFLIQACKISIKVPYLPNASERRQYRDAYYGYKENSKSPPSGGKNWMSRVSNNVRLSELTIPGTHDSAAIYGKSSTSIVRY